MMEMSDFFAYNGINRGPSLRTTRKEEYMKKQGKFSLTPILYTKQFSISPLSSKNLQCELFIFQPIQSPLPFRFSVNA
jgi:hypothetical protein